MRAPSKPPKPVEAVSGSERSRLTSPALSCTCFSGSDDSTKSSEQSSPEIPSGRGSVLLEAGERAIRVQTAFQAKGWGLADGLGLSMEQDLCGRRDPSWLCPTATGHLVEGVTPKPGSLGPRLLVMDRNVPLPPPPAPAFCLLLPPMSTQNVLD